MFLAQGLGVQAEGRTPAPASLSLHHPGPPRTLGELLNLLYYFISRDGLPASTAHHSGEWVVGVQARRDADCVGLAACHGRKSSQAPGEKPPAAFSSIAELSSPRKPPGGLSGGVGSKLCPPASALLSQRKREEELSSPTNRTNESVLWAEGGHLKPHFSLKVKKLKSNITADEGPQDLKGKRQFHRHTIESSIIRVKLGLISGWATPKENQIT